MNKEKQRDRSGWFKCRFCHVNIQGLARFVNHKREAHSEELNGNGHDAVKHEETKENAPRYRPGPKSKKMQLVVPEESQLTEPQSGTAFIPVKNPVQPASRMVHSRGSNSLSGLASELTTRDGKLDSTGKEDVRCSDHAIKANAECSIAKKESVDDDEAVRIIYDDAYDFEKDFRTATTNKCREFSRAAVAPARPRCDTYKEIGGTLFNNGSESSADLRTIPRRDGLKLLSTACSAMQRRDGPVSLDNAGTPVPSVEAAGEKYGNLSWFSNTSLTATSNNLSQPAATTTPNSSLMSFQPSALKENLTLSELISTNTTSTLSTPSVIVPNPYRNQVATVSNSHKNQQLPPAPIDVLKKDLLTESSKGFAGSKAMQTQPICFPASVPSIFQYSNGFTECMNPKLGIFQDCSDDEKPVIKDSPDSKRDQGYQPAKKIFSTLEYFHEKASFTSREFVCFRVNPEKDGHNASHITKDGYYSGYPYESCITGKALPVCRSVFPKEEEHLTPLDKEFKKLDVTNSELCEDLFQESSDPLGLKLDAANKFDLLKAKMEQKSDAINTASPVRIAGDSSKISTEKPKRGRRRRTDSNNTFKCRLCSESFSSKYNQRKHWEKVHGNFLPYQCQTCSESFAKERMLAKHILTHVEYDCKKCERKFNSKGDYERHVKMHRKLAARKTISVKSVEASKTDVTEPEILLPKTLEILPSRVFGDAKAITAVIQRGENNEFKCPFCDTGFTTSKLLEQHLKLHTREVPYKCRYCPVRFRRVSRRSAHEDSLHNQQAKITVYKCRFCPVAFKRVKQRKRHEIMHSDNKPFGCRSCPRFFANLTLLKHHEILRHSVIPKPFPSTSTLADLDVTSKFAGPSRSDEEEVTERDDDVPDNSSANDDVVAETNSKLQCKYCHQIFLWHKKLMAHEITHTGDTPYECRHCEKHFAEADARNVHQNLHTNPLPYSCYFCTSGFSDPKAQWAHETNCSEKPIMPGRKRILQKRPGSYECTYCNAVFVTQILREYHVNWHSGNNPFKCSMCPESFPMPSYRRFHMIKVHTLERKQVKTQVDTIEHAVVAPKRRGRPPGPWKRNKWIKKYLKSGTTGAAKFAGFPYAAVSSGHSADLRNGKYECEKCNKRFARQGNYLKHVQKHSVNKPYACGTCGKKYTNFSGLYQHKKTHLAKNFACIICSRNFSTDADLQTHTIIHSRPFPCSECEKTFDLEIELDAHVSRKHTKVTDFKCPKCFQTFTGSQSYWRHISKIVCVSSKNNLAATAVTEDYQQVHAVQGDDAAAANENDIMGEKAEEVEQSELYEESEEFSEDQDEMDSEFYFKCAICKAEFTDEEHSREHVNWHRLEFETAAANRS